MRVQDVRNASVNMRVSASSREGMAGQAGQRGFQRHLNEIADAQYEKHMKDLRGRIEEQGEILMARMDVNALDQYKKLIAELIGETASNAYRYLKLEKFSGAGEHRIYVVIRRVNQMLEEMTRELLKEQSDQMELLNMADDIRGLLVDLFL